MVTEFKVGRRYKALSNLAADLIWGSNTKIIYVTKILSQRLEAHAFAQCSGIVDGRVLRNVRMSHMNYEDVPMFKDYKDRL